MLLTYLQRFKNFNIEVDTNFPHSIGLLNQIVEGRASYLPDACVFGIAPSASVLKHGNKSNYTPVLLMPSQTHRVVASSPECNIKSGTFVTLTESVSSSTFYLEDLLNRSVVNREDIDTVNMEPDEVVGLLQDKKADIKAVLFFPYYEVNCFFNNCSLLDEPFDGLNLKESFLFVDEKLRRNSKKTYYLESAIRNAWLEMLETPQIIEKVVDSIFDDDRLLKFVRRFSGLHNALAASFSSDLGMSA